MKEIVLMGFFFFCFIEICHFKLCFFRLQVIRYIQRMSINYVIIVP